MKTALYILMSIMKVKKMIHTFAVDMMFMLPKSLVLCAAWLWSILVLAVYSMDQVSLLVGLVHGTAFTVSLVLTIISRSSKTAYLLRLISFIQEVDPLQLS